MTDPDDRPGVLFDVDGTLVDTNYLHVVAWWHALRAQGHVVSTATLHRTVGQGADRLLETVLGHAAPAVSDGHSDFYGPFLHQLVAFPHAAELLRRVKRAGLAVFVPPKAPGGGAAPLRRAIGGG